MNMIIADNHEVSPAPMSIRTVSGRPVDVAVRDMWLRILGPKARGDQTHILRLGVGLRRVVRLLAEIEEELEIAVPPTALLRLGTAEALIGAITRQTWPASSPCVLMKDGDGRPPLYIVSAGSGLVLELCDLAQAIDYPGQIWGLQLPGLDGEALPLNDLAAIGAFYSTTLLAHQPTGPFNLIGYSFGGSAALETARHLAAAGREVGLLGLIDSNVDEKYWPKRAWLAGVLKRCVAQMLAARHLPPKQAVDHILSRAVRLARYFGRKAAGETAASIHSCAYYIGGLEPNFQKVRDAAIVAYQNYNPHKIGLRMTLFKSELGDPHACDPVPVWRRVAQPGKLDVVMIPGSHTTMVRPPHARRLAAEIVARLPPG